METRQGKERGILKSDPRPRLAIDTRSLTPQTSWERGPVSPQPSVDRLSVTFAEPEGSMSSSGVNLFHLPSETAVTNEINGSDDEDYSVSLSAVLRQRRASVRRSRKGKTRRPSSPFLPDEPRPRRRSSAYTISSGETAVSIEEAQPGVVTQEQIFENIHLHKEVLGSVKQQPLGMRRKLKIVHQAKGYIKRHEGQLQERLAQSKSTRDIYARFNILINTKSQQLKREFANTSNLLIPWELRIKEIESHFGSVVASYFTFLRWLFWVNLVIGFILMVFVIIPEYLTANPIQDGERKIIMEEERQNASNLLTLWEFEGVLKCSPIFYGYYTNVERPEYRIPLAYFLTGLVVYIYSFVATLRKMAENSRMSKLSEKEDECIFSWKLFTGWDFMIGNAETAHNRIASVILGFKEALLEEAEKKKDLRNWRIISLRALVNICVVILLAVSAYAVITVVSRTDDNTKVRSWWRENETTIVVTVITTFFPVFFEILGFLERYHPRKQLRLQLARIMLLNLLNLYSLIFALFSKIEGMGKELDHLKPQLNMNVTVMRDIININETFPINMPKTCTEVRVPCAPHDMVFHLPTKSIDKKILMSNMREVITTTESILSNTTTSSTPKNKFKLKQNHTEEVKINFSRDSNKNTSKLSDLHIPAENLIESKNIFTSTTGFLDLSLREELNRLRKLVTGDNSSESIEFDSDDYSFDVSPTDSLPDMSPSESSSKLTPGTDTTGFFTDLSTLSNNIIDYSSSLTETTMTELTDFYLQENTPTSLTMDSESTTFMMENTLVEDSSTMNYLSTDNTISTLNSLAEFTSTFGYGEEITSDSTTILDSTERYSDYIETNSTKILNTLGLNCPIITFNSSMFCNGNNITQVFTISNCTEIDEKCYMTQCEEPIISEKLLKKNVTDIAITDVAYIDDQNRKMYNLTTTTKKKLLKLCWETMFGQELVKLTMMDLVFVLLGTLFMDFFRSLFVRYMNRCWCWDLEKKFPEYGDFKIAENILHLINNQGMVWMGMFFSPGLVVLNVFKLVIMMYLRSWAVMTCNVPHEVVFRVSKSNNFYLALLLTMLFLCVLPVGYSIVWVKPSWHCGPFSEYDKIYHILTNNIYKILPKSLNFTLQCIASPAIVIPLLVLLVLIIYYLTSLTNSLREANNDLKVQLRRERTEERRKMFQLADTRRRVGSAAMDNTPFARWKKALPTLPLCKSIDSDDRKTVSEENQESKRTTKKRGGIFAKIVNMALDRKSDVEAVSEIDNEVSPNDEESDTVFHEKLPKEVLKLKNIFLSSEQRKKNDVIKAAIFKIKNETNKKNKLDIQTHDEDEKTDKKAVLQKQTEDISKKQEETQIKMEQPGTSRSDEVEEQNDKMVTKQTSESSTQSRQSDSISSIIPVITISATESDEEILQTKETEKVKPDDVVKHETKKSEPPRVSSKKSSELKFLKRQNSVDSINEHKLSKDKNTDDGHKYQYSL